MAKDAYYFSHDSNARQDEKIIKLRMKLGWEGYGLYWALIEMLRDANDYSLETDYDSIAFELRTECERIRSIVEDFNLFELDDCFFYSESLNKRMELKESKSEKARRSAKARWDKVKKEKKANAMRTHSEGNAIKEKESKEKEIKENKNKVKDNLKPKASPLHQDLKKDFLDFYANETGNQFYWTAKEATNLKQLISKLKFSIEEKKEKSSAKKESATDEEVISSFRIILENLPKWIKEKTFTIAGINSQYMNILNQIKNGSEQTDTIEEYFRTNFGI
jgi:hypothetical protein